MFNAELADKYLKRLRRTDEATALRRVRATAADLRMWRRDSGFREAEQAALAAPALAAQCINPAEFLAGREQRWVAAASDLEQDIANRIQELSGS